MPHGIAVGIDRMKTRKTKSGPIIDMDATIVCERDSHKGIIIGKQGSMLKKSVPMRAMRWKDCLTVR